MEAIKLGLLSQSDTRESLGGEAQGPALGRTKAAPRFKSDLEALLHLTGDRGCSTSDTAD